MVPAGTAHEPDVRTILVGDDAPAVDLLGVIASPMAYALRPYVIAQKTPLVVMNAGADGLTQRQRSAYVFRTSFSNSDSSHPLGEWAYKQGYRKMVLMGADFVAAYEHMGRYRANLHRGRRPGNPGGLPAARQRRLCAVPGSDPA